MINISYSRVKFSSVSMKQLCDIMWAQVDKSCALLLASWNPCESSQEKADVIFANLFIILTVIAVFSNIALFELLVG
jgi:hypothetical protein